MEEHFSTGQSPQWAVVPMEEEEEKEEEKKGKSGGEERKKRRRRRKEKQEEEEKEKFTPSCPVYSHFPERHSVI